MSTPTGPEPGDVAVTGLGLVSPAGIGVEENWAGICAGKSPASPDPVLKGLTVDTTCRVPGFDAEAILGPEKAWRMDRFVQIAIVAAREAVADAGWDPASWDGRRVGAVIGNSLGGTATVEEQHRMLLTEGPRRVSPMTVPMSLGNMPVGFTAIDLGIEGPTHGVAAACASGTTAVGLARDLLRSGQCDVVVAGATESALTPGTMSALARMGALSRRRDDPSGASRPFDRDRDGFVAAEGAGMLVLERTADAAARGSAPRALVGGYGAASDACHPVAPREDGAGIERAVTIALADARIDGGDIGHVNAHGTSTPLNDATEARALTRALGAGTVVTSTKGVTGHTLAAAGAIEAAYTVLSLERGTVPPTANLENRDPEVELDVVHAAPRPVEDATALSTSLGFGGHNAALVLRRGHR